MAGTENTNVKHEDVGRTILNARKDLKKQRLTPDYFEKMTDSQREQMTKKNNVWHIPNYETLVEEKGVHYAACVKVLRDNIALAPVGDRGDDFNTAAKKYVEFVTWVHDVCEKNSSFEDLRQDLLDGYEDFGRYGYLNSKNTVRRYKQAIYYHMNYDVEKLIRRGFPNSAKNRRRSLNPEQEKKPWMKKITSGHLTFRKNPALNGYYVYKASRSNSIDRENILNYGAPIDKSNMTEDEFNVLVEKIAKEHYEAIQAMKKEAFNRPHLKDIPRPKYKDITGEDLISTFGISGIQFGEWVDNKERQAVLDHAFSSFMNLSKALNIEPYKLGLGGRLGLAFGARGTGGKNAAAAHYEPAENVINLTKMSGAGSLAHEWFHAFDSYMGREYSSQPFEPRNTLYMTARRKEIGLDQADYSLRALDKLKPEEIGAVVRLVDLNLKKKRDNLDYVNTCIKHADDRLEHIMKRYEPLSTGTESYPGENNDAKEKIREEKIVSSITKAHAPFDKYSPSNFFTRSTDKRTQSDAMAKYHGLVIEVGARSFEASVHKLLSDMNISDPYLVNGVFDMSEEQAEKLPMVYPYPVADELKEISQNLREFMNVMSHRLDYDREITRQYVPNFEELEAGIEHKIRPQKTLSHEPTDIDVSDETPSPKEAKIHISPLPEDIRSAHASNTSLETTEPEDKTEPENVETFKPEEVNVGDNYGFGF